MADLTGRTVAFLVAAEGIEQVELTRPWQALTDAGATALLVSPEAGTVQAFNHLDKADTFPVDRTVADLDPASVDLLVLPGGVANPDALRTDKGAVDLVRSWVAGGKPTAAICHAPWTLAEADVLSGRTLTSWPSLQTDLRNAGATWVDEEVHVDRSGPGALITSRNPDDLDAFCRALVSELAGE